LHHADQVKRDFENSLHCLSDNGVILIHDTDPKEERFTVVPRERPGRWNGDVFKFIAHLDEYGVSYRTVDTDPNGLTIVNPQGWERLATKQDIDFKGFIQNRREILRLCTLEEFKQWI
jgi:hypothetical protein